MQVTAVSVVELGQAGGFPASMPRDDVPHCGEWTPTRCREALRQCDQIGQVGRAELLEREIAAAVTEIAGWLDQAVRRYPGSATVGFAN
ncbi:hypothetical protein [Kitasatospora purpeofusca]|uniref:DUF7691 family protein n=1 Tax=Kitasatospora purpeofusca TaxID=67352 RepID=UPI003869219C